MITLSLDPSTVETGWAIFHDESLVQSGSWQLNKLQTLEEREVLLLALLSSKLVDRVVCENIYFGVSASTSKALSKLQGCIQLHFFLRQIPVDVSLNASAWRRILGLGKEKENAIEYVSNKYNKCVKNDEADAICLGEAYLRREAEYA